MNKNRAVKVIILAVVLIAGVYLTRSRSYPDTFEVTNNTSKIITDRKQNYSGATLVNLDEDDEQEIFISGSGSNNLLLKRNQDLFHPMDIPELSDPKGLTFSVTACDLDQDGRDEILILNRPNPLNGDSHSRILKFANSKWADILPMSDPITKSIEFGYSASCIDRKGNGKYGLAISNEDGKISYLEMVDSKIKDIAEEIGVALKSKGRSVLGIPSPIGYTNIFIGNEKGSNFYFVNKGDGTYTEKSTEVGLSDSSFDARGISIIDLNYDDIPDVVYGNHYGPVRLLEQTREGKFKDVTPEVMQHSYSVNSAVVGDFNLDGYEDIYLNNIRGDNKVFTRDQNDWYELYIEALAEKEMFGISTIAADLDKNGSFEILNTHGDGSSFPITLYSLKPINPWIKFSVHYSSRGIPRGAIVRIRTTKRDHVRVISTGSGRFANYDSDVIFGLLKNESVISSEVILPSGKKFENKGNLKLMSTNEIIIPLGF